MFDKTATLDVAFALYGGFENPEFQQMLYDSKPYIERFERQTGQKLITITATCEEGAFEPAYIFDDGMGFHYTLEGVLNSLDPL